MNKIAKVGIVFFLVLMLLAGNIRAYTYGDYTTSINQGADYFGSVGDAYKSAIIMAVENILIKQVTAEQYSETIKKNGIPYQKDNGKTGFIDIKYPERFMLIVNYEVKDFNGAFDSNYMGSNDVNNVNKEDYDRIKRGIKKDIYGYIKNIINLSDEEYNKLFEEKQNEIESALIKESSSEGEYLNMYTAWLRGVIWGDIFNVKVKIEIQEEQGLTEEEMETYTQEFYEVIDGMTKEELENRLKGWKGDLEAGVHADEEIRKKIETWCKLAEAELEKMETEEKVTEQAKNQYGFYTQPTREEENSTVHSIDEVIKEGKTFLEKGGDDAIVGDALINTSTTIYNIFFGIGIVVAVAVGAGIGIKFMVSTVDEKAEIKQILVPYVIGCFIIFGAFGIWKLAMQIVTNLK